MQSLSLIIKGNIITVANQKPRAEAIGVVDDTIVSVGTVIEVEKRAGKSTRVLDLKGKTILPGFMDTHTHPMGTGRNRLGVDLSSVTSVGETLDIIREKAKNTPAGRWIYCPEYNRLFVAEKRLPTLKELDEISVRHPISIRQVDGHFSMLNTAALELLHLEAGMDGILTDAKGKPTGEIQDPATGNTMEAIGAFSDEAERMDALMLVTGEAASAGITTLFAKEPLESIEFIFKNIKRIPVRINPMIMGAAKGLLGLDKVINADFLGDKVCVAIVADGAVEAHTAALYEPYTDDPETLGMLALSDDELYNFVEKAHKAGFQISIHAESDRSIEQVLWVYEKVLEKYPRLDHRHRIEHFELPTMRQINKAAGLGVVLAMQPMFIKVCEGPNLDYYRALLGDERVKRGHPFRSILDRGVLVSGGSDSPVTRMNPLGGMQACVNHPLKEQRIDVYEAIEMFTINGAKTGFEEDLKGSIEAGKLADLVVLSDDPYRVTREKLGDIKVEMTIVGGKVVYERRS